MKLNTTLEQAKEFVKTGEVVLVELKGVWQRLAMDFVEDDKAPVIIIQAIKKNLPTILSVGSVRSICHKGKKIWYCPQCKDIDYNRTWNPEEEDGVDCRECVGDPYDNGIIMKPLQFTVESIEEKKLFDNNGEMINTALTKGHKYQELWDKIKGKKFIDIGVNADVWVIKGKVKQ